MHRHGMFELWNIQVWGCGSDKCHASLLLKRLQQAVGGMSTGGRPSNVDADFMNGLAAMFGTSGTPDDVVSGLTGLSSRRLKAMAAAPNQKKKKKRSDAATDEDENVVHQWVLATARRSADKTNMLLHKNKGPHLVFCETWMDAEAHPLFKKSHPEFKHEKTVFDRFLRNTWWLKKPRNSNCLCSPCTNMQLLMTGLRSFQKRIGLDDGDIITQDRFNDDNENNDNNENENKNDISCTCVHTHAR